MFDADNPTLKATHSPTCQSRRLSVLSAVLSAVLLLPSGWIVQSETDWSVRFQRSGLRDQGLTIHSAS